MKILNYNFNVKKTTNDCILWIKNWFEENGKHCNAVIGISGGKDSSVVAGLCVKALGKDRVIGVLMPNGLQKDKLDSLSIVTYLGIKYTEINIQDSVQGIIDNICDIYVPESDGYNDIHLTDQTKINLPSRIRMATLYAISQSLNGRVINTCNLSEDWVGYSTRYGDSVGDMSPLSKLTSDEVIQIGEFLKIPDYLIHKAPSDGLCGKTDEDNLGFTYAVLNKYIRTGECEDLIVKKKIDDMNNKNKFKLKLMQNYEPEIGYIYEA